MNIFDVLQAEKTGESVRRFKRLKDLSEYSIENEKVFGKKDAKGGALKFLLKQIVIGREMWSRKTRKILSGTQPAPSVVVKSLKVDVLGGGGGA